MVMMIEKVISALPPTLTADTIYVVRTGMGFDLRVTDATGVVAHTLNLPNGGGSNLSGDVIVTVPLRSHTHKESVVAAGVTPASRVIVGLAGTAASDQNEIEFIDILALAAIVTVAGFLDITLTFSQPMTGPIKLNWIAF